MKNPATSAEFFKRYGPRGLDFSLPARMTLPGAVAGRPSALRPSPPPHGAGLYVRISVGLAVTVFYPGNVISFGFAPALPSPFSFAPSAPLDK